MKSRVVLGLSLASLLFLLGFLILADRSEARQYPTVSSTLQPIVMWSGTLAEIPDGWQLCDGTNGTPDLRDRFVLGTQTGEVPGETGGAHEVQLTEANLPSHRHYFQTETDGVHQHSFEDKHCDLFPDILAGGAVLADHAGEDYDYPSHTSDSTGDHSHTGITDHEGNAEPFDNRPACFRLAFITRVKGKPRSAFGVVKGSIIVWSGEDSSIPDGWQLCDGTNGTPDLRSRFVVGVQDGQDPGETTGTDAIQLAVENLPAHDHPFQTTTAGYHSHTYSDTWVLATTLYTAGPILIYGTWAADYWEYENSSLSGFHSHTGTTGYEGTGNVIDNRPVYYTFAFIMRTAATASTRAQSTKNIQHVERHLYPIPKGSIVFWSGDETTIPFGWQFCDGSNGSPDLRDRFIRGGDTPGETGGSNSLEISLGTMPQHDHTFTTDPNGEHSHLIKDHFRDVVGYWVMPWYYKEMGNLPFQYATHHLDPTGDHSHTGYTEYSGLTSPEPYDNRPAYYKLAFIMKVL